MSKASGSPRNMSTQKVKKPSKQRKIPKGLAIMKFCHYGTKLVDLFNNDATPTPNQAPGPASDSESVVSASQDTPCDTLYSNSSFLPDPPSANPFYPQIPPSGVYLENPSRVMHCGMEPWAVPISSYVPFQDEVQPVHPSHIPAMSSNSYGRYADTSQLVPPPSGLSMGHNDEPFWFPELNPYPTSSYVSNGPMTSTHSQAGTMYNDGTAGPSHLTMLPNDPTMTFFSNNDNPFYYTWDG